MPDIKEWLQKISSEKAEVLASYQVTDSEGVDLKKASTKKTKQNPTDFSAGEPLQNQKTSQANNASDASQVISKQEDSEDQTNNSKDSPLP